MSSSIYRTLLQITGGFNNIDKKQITTHPMDQTQLNNLTNHQQTPPTQTNTNSYNIQRQHRALKKPNIILEKLIKKNEAFLTSLGKNPMYDAVIHEIKDRKIRIGKNWLIDWASCNYLGFDLDQEIIDSIPEYVNKWGTHPSWSRMLGSPVIYEQLENKLKNLLQAEDCLCLPNLTLTSNYCIFILSEGGEIFLDKRSHRTLYEGAMIAKGNGAKITYFDSQNLEYLDFLLKMSTSHKKMICIDGVFSMHGQYADVKTVAEISRKHGALLYIDDAHGFGLLGERSKDESCPYGDKGNSIIRHFNETYDNIVMVTTMSKAYSSYVAVMCCSTDVKQFLKAVLAPYLYTGPAPVATLATALKGLEANEKRGDQIRADIYEKCSILTQAIKDLNFRTDNTTNFPIYNFYLENPDQINEVAEHLFQEGIYVTLAPYPMVAKKDVGFRVQITAANTKEELNYLIRVLGNLPNYFPIQTTNVQIKQTA